MSLQAVGMLKFRRIWLSWAWSWGENGAWAEVGKKELWSWWNLEMGIPATTRFPSFRNKRKWWVPHSAAIKQDLRARAVPAEISDKAQVIRHIDIAYPLVYDALEGHNMISRIFLPKMHKLNLIKETPVKLKLRDILQSNLPVPFKSIKVMKNKKRMRKCPRWRKLRRCGS